MNIAANNIASKLFVAFVAVAMLFTLVSPAKAQTAAELQAQIDTLMAQIAALSGQVGQGGQSVASGVCPYTWTRSLAQGASGADVMKLQQFLNADVDTRISASGVGSVGMETEYYGSLTANAVSRFQVKNGVVAVGTGTFGPLSMGKANMICNTPAVVVPPVVTPGDDTTDDTDDTTDDSDDSAELGNDEGSITVSSASGDESNLDEGQEGGVLGFDVEVDGDVEINRIDVYAAEDGTESENADDYFVRAFLMMDGEEVAGASVDVEDWDQDDYDLLADGSGDDYRIRFSGLNLVFADGDEPEFQVGFEVVSNLDSADLTTQWDVGLDSVRFVDGEGFTDTEEDDSSWLADDTFGFDEEEMGELTVSDSNDNPEDSTIEVDNDDQTDDVEVFVFEIEEENGVDVTVEDMTLTATALSSTSAAMLEDAVVAEASLYMDDELLDTVSISSTGVLDFENLGIEIAGDETVTLTVKLTFEDQNDGANYFDGTTVQVDVTSIDSAEDANGNDEDDMNITINSSAESEIHTLRTEGISAEFNEDDSDNDTNTSNNVIAMEFVVDVTAFGEDAVLTASDFNYTLASSTGNTPVVSVKLDGNDPADEDPTDTFTVNEGDTAEFTFTVTITLNGVEDSGTYNVTLDDVDGEVVDEDLETTASYQS